MKINKKKNKTKFSNFKERHGPLFASQNTPKNYNPNIYGDKFEESRKESRVINIFYLIL